MKIICSTNIPYAKEAFSRLGDVVILPPDAITRRHVRDAEMLCVRSTTQVNRTLLDGSKVRFVGTTTIGIDHMDTDYMDKAGIVWRSAAGCNANSVSEYVITALLCLAQRHAFQLEGKTMGIVGVGNVGGLVAAKAEALGMRVLKNDPPRRDAEDDHSFLPLKTILAESDIITLHTPLTRGGKYPTMHLADNNFFNKLKPGAVFINTARGAILESDALLKAIKLGAASHTVLDTWENEPAFRQDVLKKADLGTPHIAGHSFEGKVMGTVMIFKEACRFLGKKSRWSPDSLLPEPLVPHIAIDAKNRGGEEVLWQIIRKVYDIESDDRRMRKAAVDDVVRRSENFELLRRNYPVRREFRFTEIEILNDDSHIQNKAFKLGFSPARTCR